MRYIENLDTGEVLGLTDAEYERFFDNRDPNDWVVKEKTNIRPGTYYADVIIEATVSIDDLTQDEIDEHGANVFEWAMNEDFDMLSFSIKKVQDVKGPVEND